MGQVRDHITSDDHALTEWVARKIHNHNPMRQRSKERGHVTKTVLALDIDQHLVRYVSADGQVFDITVTARGSIDELALTDREMLTEKVYSYAGNAVPKKLRLEDGY